MPTIPDSLAIELLSYKSKHPRKPRGITAGEWIMWLYRDAPEGECWTWHGKPNDLGYCRVGTGTGPQYVHRVAYVHAVGPIPEGLELDHLCRNQKCCNPTHLEPVTHQENLRRARLDVRGEKCPAGDHLWEPLATGVRQCRICRNEYMKAYNRARRAAIKATSSPA